MCSKVLTRGCLTSSGDKYMLKFILPGNIYETSMLL